MDLGIATVINGRTAKSRVLPTMPHKVALAPMLIGILCLSLGACNRATQAEYENCMQTAAQLLDVPLKADRLINCYDMEMSVAHPPSKKTTKDLGKLGKEGVLAWIRDMEKGSHSLAANYAYNPLIVETYKLGGYNLCEDKITHHRAARAISERDYQEENAKEKLQTLCEVYMK